MTIEFFISTEEADYVARRQQMRKQRRLRIFQRIWQLTFITGLTGGLVWVAMLPDWQLRSANQIDIEGNNLLSKEIIKKALPIKYPQSIFQIQPQAIATQLWQLSRSSQVLCVTHQPLIAAIADRHFHVSKQVAEDRTHVQIRLLELEERKQELAQIASGMTVEEEKKKKEKGKNGNKESVNGKVSQAIAFAESLLEQATAIKANI